MEPSRATDARAAIALRRGPTLAAIVRGELERMILAGEIKAGERLNEQALAARLGVSRGPVREAARALETAGLLVGKANLGVFVRDVGVEEASEIYDVRAVVFGFVCEVLARRITEGEARDLTGRVSRMDAAIEAGDAAEYYRENLAFHDAIVAAARHERARRTYEGLINETHLTRRLALETPERMRASNREHAELVAALTAGDAALARRLGESHAQGGKRRWQEATGIEASASEGRGGAPP